MEEDTTQTANYLPFLLPRLPPWWPVPLIPVTTTPTMMACSCYHDSPLWQSVPPVPVTMDSYHDSLYLLFLLPWLPIITICAFCSCYHDDLYLSPITVTITPHHDGLYLLFLLPWPPPWRSVLPVPITMSSTITAYISRTCYHDSTPWQSVPPVPVAMTFTTMWQSILRAEINFSSFKLLLSVILFQPHIKY